MLELRQSTASQEIMLGPFLDDTDGKTAETALTIANTDIKLWKEGGTTESNKSAGGGTHIAGGRYYIVLDATDTDTLGKLEINVHVAGALPVKREYMVRPANIYDSLVLNTDKLQADAVELNGVAQSLLDLKDFADEGYDPATNKVQGVVLVDTITVYTGNTVQTGDNFARIGATGSGLTSLASQASVNTIDDLLDTEVAAIITTLGVAGAGLTALGDARIVNLDATISSRASQTTLDTLDNFVDTEVAAIKAVTDKLDTAMVLDGAVYQFTVNALELAPTGGSAPTVGQIADAVWDELLAGHLGAGSAGAALNGAGSAGDPWTTTLPGAYGAGTAGKIVGDNINATIASRATQVSVDTVDTIVDAIKVKTDALPTDPADESILEAAITSATASLATSAALTTVAGNVVTVLGHVDTEIAAIKAKTDLIPASPAAIGSTMTLSAGERTAVVAALFATLIETSGIITR